MIESNPNVTNVHIKEEKKKIDLATHVKTEPVSHPHKRPPLNHHSNMAISCPVTAVPPHPLIFGNTSGLPGQNAFDLIDLDDIFSEDFFPADVDFSNIFQNDSSNGSLKGLSNNNSNESLNDNTGSQLLNNHHHLGNRPNNNFQDYMSQQQFFRNNAELLSRQFLNDPSLAGNVPFPPGFNPNMWMGQGPNMPPQGHPQMMNMGNMNSGNNAWSGVVNPQGVIMVPPGRKPPSQQPMYPNNMPIPPYVVNANQGHGYPNKMPKAEPKSNRFSEKVDISENKFNAPNQSKQSMPLGYSTTGFNDEDFDLDDDLDDDSGGKKKKYKGGDIKHMTELQKIERRERNREHAKRSRVRKRVLLDTLQNQLAALRTVNAKLRKIVTEKIPSKASEILQKCTTEESLLLATEENEKETVLSFGDYNSTRSGSTALTPQPKTPKILMEPDFRLIQALNHAQHNFVLTDPSLPDNPIVYCSEGFCKLTGYKRQYVLGRNCRFLQGPDTDPAAVEIIRKGILEGRDISVCLLNYRADGTTFWNQFFVAALRDGQGVVVNFVGVQCEVNAISIAEIKDRVKRLPMPDSL